MAIQRRNGRPPQSKHTLKLEMTWTRGSCVLVWKFPQPFVANQGAEVQRVLHDFSVGR